MLICYEHCHLGNETGQFCNKNCLRLLPKAIETALDCLKSANTEPYYRRQAWEVIKCFLVAMTSLEDNKHALYQLLSHPK